MDGQNFQNEQNTSEGVQTTETTNNYQDYTANVQPAQTVVDAPQQNSTLAIVSLVLGIISILCGCCFAWIGCLFGIGGIVCAVLSNKNGKSGLATAGLICSIAGIVVGLVITVLGAVLSVALLDELNELNSGYYY